MSKQPFKVVRIEQGIYQITDVLDNRAYIVAGEQSAVLIDTCGGYGDLRAFVQGILSLPLTVLLTHSHYDHIGGAYFYDEVRMSPLEGDRWNEEAQNARTTYPQLLENGTFDETTPWALRDGRRPRVLEVGEGDVFDLGGTTVEAIALPGHTPGSMGYLVRERRVLLSGDAVTPIMCLFFKESLGIGTYRQTLAKMAELPFDRFYTGHHDVSFPRTSLPSFDACAEYALTDRGSTWRHTLLPDFMGTIHFAPCDTTDVDGPKFRALIGPYVPRPPRKRKRH
ncbi:MAG: MBL fold metallo-hydrolase [Atopobiaceae bacterium]|nr:MBL fold metallo-hydrolase [Atopobiaceae bacterium]